MPKAHLERIDIESERPQSFQVAYRCLCLAAYIMRGQIEKELAEDARSRGAEESFKRLSQFSSGTPLMEWFSQREAAAAARDLGTWPRQEWINAIWRAEALTCLLWAIQKIEIPAYDTLVELAALAQAVPLLAPKSAVSQFLLDAQLRDGHELTEHRELAESWHWRARTHALAIGMYGGTPEDKFNEYARESALRRAEEGWFETIDEDYPVYGKAYRTISRAEHSTLGSIARERHYALNWLCGHAADWDEITTDT